MQREMTAAMIRMAEFMVVGTPVDDAAVLAEVHLHYQGIGRFWTPNRRPTRAWAACTSRTSGSRSNYERIAQGLAQYQYDAMVAYADVRLSD